MFWRIRSHALSLHPGQAVFAVLEDARREHGIAADKYQNYETIIAELRAQLAAKISELQRCYEDKDRLFAELAKMRGKLDLLMNMQGTGDTELIKQLREQRDKAVSEAETLKGQVEEMMRLLRDEKEATSRAEAAEQDAKRETDRLGGQVKLLREEKDVAVSEMRQAKKERAESVATADRLKGELLVVREQIAEEEKERIRHRDYLERTRGELDKSRGEAMQLREVTEEQRERTAALEDRLREAKSEPAKLQGQVSLTSDFHLEL